MNLEKLFSPRTAIALGLAAALAACADGTLPPMGAGDPANPRAPESPAIAAPTPPSTTEPSPVPGVEHAHAHAHGQQGAAEPKTGGSR